MSRFAGRSCSSSCAWRGIGRITMISLGVLFHMMTWLTLGLWVFPLVCYSGYLAFMNEKRRGVDPRRSGPLAGAGPRAARGCRPDFSKAANCGRCRPFSPPGATEPSRLSPSLTAIGGVGLEHYLDPYGIRRPEGPYAPQGNGSARSSTKCSRRRAASATRTRCSCSTSGRCCVGGAVFDRRTQFHQGETVRIECDLNPPHEDLWIECNLHDSENRAVDTIGVFVTCDDNRRNVLLQPGRLHDARQV